MFDSDLRKTPQQWLEMLHQNCRLKLGNCRSLTYTNIRNDVTTNRTCGVMKLVCEKINASLDKSAVRGLEITTPLFRLLSSKTVVLFIALLPGEGNFVSCKMPASVPFKMPGRVKAVITPKSNVCAKRPVGPSSSVMGS